MTSTTTVSPPSFSSSVSAVATTAFSAKIRRLIYSTIGTIILAWYGSGILLSSLPFLVVSIKMIKSDGPEETSLQYWSKNIIFHIFYYGFLLLGSYVALLPLFGVTTMRGWHALSLYLPSYVISSHDRSKQYGVFGSFILRHFFDIPLLWAAFVCREVFGLRMLSPFCNILDETIVQGSLPFPSDIKTLAEEPYNVGLIINMCDEYNGAVKEMTKYGIVQCRLPHQDTTAPSYESVMKGCKAIKEFRRKSKNKRVYIHCKGGIARASTMTLAHYIWNENKDPDAAIKEMKSKRHVVMVTVQTYPAIIQLINEKKKKELNNNNNTNKEPSNLGASFLIT